MAKKKEKKKKKQNEKASCLFVCVCLCVFVSKLVRALKILKGESPAKQKQYVRTSLRLRTPLEEKEEEEQEEQFSSIGRGRWLG
jgi:hypothetical protein